MGGASDIGIEESPSERHLWADDLHHVLSELDMSPAYLGGWSAGSAFSLFMAHRYPEDVRGLILMDSPTDNPDVLTRLGRGGLHLREVRAAESGGMEAVIEESTKAYIRSTTGVSKPEEWLPTEVAVGWRRRSQRTLPIEIA